MMSHPAASPDDLGVLAPVARRVDLANGAVVEVLPLTVRQLRAFLRALGTARDDMADPEVDVWDHIADHGEAITDALAVAIDMPRALVNELPHGDYLACINAVMEANRDFFTSWLLRPTMARWARSAEASPDGPMFSPASSPQGTTQSA